MLTLKQSHAQSAADSCFNSPERQRKEPEPAGPVRVNDVHSRLNETLVKSERWPASLHEVQVAIERAKKNRESLSIAGGRHAMGGQQFLEGGVLLDLSRMNDVLGFDSHRGILEVEAGIQWPKVLDYLREAERACERPWGIVQKQTGADRLSLGGAVSANIHGRGLRFSPIVQDIESFDLVDAEGEVRHCSRAANPDLFSLAIGGYGLFGIVYCIKLRLSERRKLQRIVQICDAEDLMPAFDRHIAGGSIYGDFQFDINPASPGFLRRGVLACYRPVDPRTNIPPDQRRLSEQDWLKLIGLAHSDKGRAYDLYSQHYLSTSGQIYWSDCHQMSTYIDDYHSILEGRPKGCGKASEMITEVYVPRERLPMFLKETGEDFRRRDVEVVYGTVRLIEPDRESFLPWARQSYACIVLNLHIEHRSRDIDRAIKSFRRVTDRAIEFGGSFFLTYHRWATRRQIEACYPQFAQFLELKQRHDPHELFQSNWYRHYKRMFA